MRPKKVLLCVMPDPEMLGVLSFMLTTNGYRALTANTAAEAAANFTSDHFDLLLVTQDQLKSGGPHSGAELINSFKALQPGIHTLLFYENGKLPMDSPADICVALPCRAADLLERIKVLSARKRGPHKGYIRKPPAADIQPQPASVAAAGA